MRADNPSSLPVGAKIRPNGQNSTERRKRAVCALWSMKKRARWRKFFVMVRSRTPAIYLVPGDPEGRWFWGVLREKTAKSRHPGARLPQCPRRVFESLAVRKEDGATRRRCCFWPTAQIGRSVVPASYPPSYPPGPSVSNSCRTDKLDAGGLREGCKKRHHGVERPRGVVKVNLFNKNS